MTSSYDWDELLAHAVQRICLEPHSLGPVSKRLQAAIEYSLLGGGKRLRPRLTMAAGALTGIDPQVCQKSALAVEMFHCFTLIHDDLPCMDDDDFRRGKPSNHKQYGEPTALLAGDALYGMAVETLLETAPSVSSSAFAAALKEFLTRTGIRGVMGGQMDELTYPDEPVLQDLEQVHLKKTAALFQASLLLPACLAGWSCQDPRYQALETLGRNFGIAFQLLDDLEDSTQDDRVSVLQFMPADQARKHAHSLLSQGVAAMNSAFQNQWTPVKEVIQSYVAL